LPDYLGNIPVPEIVPSGVFPLVTDYPYGMTLAPGVVVHQFGSGNAKIEQRFFLGNGARRFTFRKAAMRESEREALHDFWEEHQGPYGAFYYDAPNPDGTFTRYTCRFANEPLAWEMVSDAASSTGLTLIEIPSGTPEYPLNQTVTRFPSQSLEAALLSQVQEIIPLVRIQPREPDYPTLYVSDRRCRIGDQLYLPRLLDFDGISQSMGNEADEARFVFGNADRVMRDLATDVDLYRAEIELSLYHVGTGIKLDLWKGDIVDWAADSGPEFQITAADGLYELNLPCPCRKISRTCWKEFDDGFSCPAATEGGTNLSTPCDKGFDTPAGCVFHNMQDYFGGILAKPQAVRVKDNSTGVWGFGRSTITSVSLVADSIYDQVVPEIYTNTPMPVNTKIAAGRDEGDFYIALGVVGEGPLGAYGQGHQLDGQLNHGPGNLGLRTSLGNDPNPDPFSLGAGGEGVQSYGPERAAGTAFIEIRRTDPKGLQLSRLGEHSLQAVVDQGLRGWVWTAAGQRSLQLLTSPVWIAINMLLRARGLRFADAETAEQYFDVDAAIAAAAICDERVPKLVGEGYETQFLFKGILQEEKPLRDWIQEVLMNSLSFCTFAFGKLKVGIRVNSSALEAFSTGNILFQSLQLAPAKPSFNHLTANFADEEFEFVSNSVQVYDIDHAKLQGAVSPLFLKSNMNLSGASTKSQAARIIAVRLREELGGTTAEEWKKARQLSFRTTVLALNVEPGMVCSLTHEDMPEGYGEFRVTGWRLNKDFSIDIQGRTTTDSMYDLVSGPKPADVPADPVPEEVSYAPADWNFDADTDTDGTLRLRNLTCKSYADGVDRAVFEVYYIPEDEVGYAATSDTMLANEQDTTMEVSGEPPRDGEWVLVEREIMAVEKVVPSGVNMSTATVRRGPQVFGDPANTADLHQSAITEVLTVDPETKAVLTLPTGLAIQPGWILYLVPEGAGVVEWQYISGYDAATGQCELVRPFETVSVGQQAMAHPRVWRVTAKTVPVNLGANFFRRPDRARYAVEIPLPFAGVVAVRGYLETRFGIRSNVLLKLFTAQAPQRLRTFGTTQYLMSHPDLPVGQIQDAFQRIRVETTQSFERAFAQKRGGQTAPPVKPPRSVATAVPSAFEYGGIIDIAGVPAPGDTISVSLGNPASESVFVQLPLYVVSSPEHETIAAGLCAWMNATEQFAAWYAAEVSGSQVRISDKRGVNGLISVQTSGGVTATAAGITSKLGISLGRRYALTFQDSVGGWESEPGPLSYSTGPTGGATRIEISDLPRTAGDDRVDRLRIWAAPDGQEAPLRLIVDVAIGAAAVADTFTEADLAIQAAYPGASQPASPGRVQATVKKDGAPWFELRIPADQSQSNIIHGLALNNVPQGTEITVDLDNQAEMVDLDVVLQ
jgi:hypothetical protein